jgi:hypothetical protein
MKMAILRKAICESNVKIPMAFFTEQEKSNNPKIHMEA